jgi:hypothetical protein
MWSVSFETAAMEHSESYAGNCRCTFRTPYLFLKAILIFVFGFKRLKDKSSSFSRAYVPAQSVLDSGQKLPNLERVGANAGWGRHSLGKRCGSA